MKKYFKGFIKNYYFAYNACMIINELFDRKEVIDKNGNILEGIRDQLYYEMGYVK